MPNKQNKQHQKKERVSKLKLAFLLALMPFDEFVLFCFVVFFWTCFALYSLWELEPGIT